MQNNLVPLKDCPIGLFKKENTLCVKTEYGLDAYIVSSGEYFWGGAKTKEERANVLVSPIPDEVVERLETDPHITKGEILSDNKEISQIVVVIDNENNYETEYVGVKKVLYTATNFVVCMNDGRDFNFMKPFYSYRFKTVVSHS